MASFLHIARDESKSVNLINYEVDICFDVVKDPLGSMNFQILYLTRGSVRSNL